MLLISNMHGDVFLYDNIDNNLTGTFTRIDTILSGALGTRTGGQNLTVSGGDLNNDGIPDMLVGLFSGGMQIFRGLTVGIHEVAEKGNPFECFPNPAGTTLTIRFLKDADSKHHLRMFNTLGEVVLERNITGPTLSFDVGNLPAGFYCVEISSRNKSFFQKVLIYH